MNQAKAASRHLNSFRKSIGKSIGSRLASYRDRIRYARLDDKLVRDPIFGFQRLHPHEVLIVDSPIFQRLRGIFQTSMAFLTYPSSIHTRFEHSINCLHMASKIMDALKSRGMSIENTHETEVRLAALLHDVGHSIFSHGSEFFYKNFKEVRQSLAAPEVEASRCAAGELVNYCIITSQEFREYLWEPIVSVCKTLQGCGHIGSVDLKRIAQMVIGLPPGGRIEHRFLTDIINGPVDVDKLDYLARDSYFTGVNLAVDIDRLLPSVRVAEVKNEETGRDESRLVVDHRGVAVVEQLLFARMILYDTVYHHHKVRAATCNLHTILRNFHEKKVWPTRTGRLVQVADFLDMDEYDFLGHPYRDDQLMRRVRDLRDRHLMKRALVVLPRGLVDAESHTTFMEMCNEGTNPAGELEHGLLERLRSKILSLAKAEDGYITADDFAIDVPDPPAYTRLGEEIHVLMADGYTVQLNKLFPFYKVVNNYSKQYKYRNYLFAVDRFAHIIAYAGFLAFREMGMKLNDLGLLLAHQDKKAKDLILMRTGQEILDHRRDCYVPDEVEERNVAHRAV